GLEILDVPRERAETVARGWLERLGLSGPENHYPHALSGGMRPRVSIAPPFAVEPHILLCDQPVSPLHEMTARDLRAEFLRLVQQNGKTAVFVTHHINEAIEIGDRILVFHRPARIALEIHRSRGADEERSARERILEVLALEDAAPHA